MKYLETLKNSFKELLTKKNLLYFSSLPLFVNWYLVLVFFYEEESLRKQSLRSCVLSFLFFLLLVVSWLSSKLPFLGAFLGNLVHFFGILLYVGTSLFFVYKIYKDQNLDLALLDNQVKNLETFLTH